MAENRTDTNQSQCCTTKSMCGQSLAQGVYIVGWSSVAISSVMLLSCVLYLYINCNRVALDPVLGIMTLSTMTVTCMSAYQIVISILMLWQRMQKKPKPFYYSLWYVSHLTLITLYCMICSAIVVVHMGNNETPSGVLYFIYGSAYIGILIYFEIVINSYLNSGNVGERFL